MKRIVVVDDEVNIGRSLRLILEREGYAVAVATTIAACRAHAETARADLFLIDVRLPDGSGIDLVRELGAADLGAPAIMISGHGTIRDAIEATRAGAYDFLEKPLGRDKLLVAIANALDHSRLREENARLKELAAGARMIGGTAAFVEVVEQATRAARSDARILILGESGSGKELLAAHIHQSSPFAAGPFVKVNCAAIPTELIESELFGHEKGAFTGASALRRGKFEQADSGTLFLDEVADLHEASQAKLLRVLESGEFQRVGGESSMRVAVRVVSATNRDLEAMVGERKFREDLYYRLAVVPIRVPALRERPRDIRPLAEYFLADFCTRNNFRAKTIDQPVYASFERYAWPGNARELRNVIERMAILTPAERLTVEAVPLEIRMERPAASSALRDVRESAEREQILRALDQSGGNVAAAARRLGVERTNLHKRIRALGLQRHDKL